MIRKTRKDYEPIEPMFAVVTHDVRLEKETYYVELRKWRLPDMMLPYPYLRADTVHDARMWQEIEHPSVRLMWVRQENHWDDDIKQMVWGDVIDLHRVTFPKYCNDPFWQQFDNPLMAYSGHGLSYDYWFTDPPKQPCGTDHIDYMAAMAARAHEKFESLPDKPTILKAFYKSFQEKRND